MDLFGPFGREFASLPKVSGDWGDFGDLGDGDQPDPGC